MRKIWVIVLCFSVVCSIWAQEETNKGDDLSKQVEELQKQVRKLEMRIDSLEKQLEILSKRSVEIPETFPKLHKVPEGWKEHEFNGIKYYIIPVKSESTKINQQKK